MRSNYRTQYARGVPARENKLFQIYSVPQQTNVLSTCSVSCVIVYWKQSAVPLPDVDVLSQHQKGSEVVVAAIRGSASALCSGPWGGLPVLPAQSKSVSSSIRNPDRSALHSRVSTSAWEAEMKTR